MKIIGLTGGIACGKSSVSAILKQKGAAVIDADKISHSLAEPGGMLYEMYVQHFGKDVLQDGVLDRGKIADIIYTYPKEKEWIDSKSHPVIACEMAKQLNAAMAESSAPAVILDVPLLFESGWQKYSDVVWTVAAKRDVQIERIIKRDGLSREEAEKRIDAQMPLDEKCRLADIVINNDGTEAELRQEVDSLWDSILGVRA